MWHGVRPVQVYFSVCTLTENLTPGILHCPRDSPADRATTIFKIDPVTESSASCLTQQTLTGYIELATAVRQIHSLESV